MLIFLGTLLATLSSMVRPRAALALENLALRHQVGVLQRSVRKRPKLTTGDRLFWVCLSRLWCDWRSALVIVKPETVVAWHRAGSRLSWTWKVRRGQPGRPVVSREFRELIRKMCRENPTWGAPRIHGELLKLGIDIGESSVSKYMVRGRKPPSRLKEFGVVPHRSFYDYETVATENRLSKCSGRPLGLCGQRLPKLNLIPIQVIDPGKATVGFIHSFGINLYSLLF